MSRRLPVFFAVLMAAGCGWLPNHYLDYREAGSIKPASVPEDLVFIGEEPLFPVPQDVPAPVYEDDDDFEVPEPPQLAIPGRDEPGEAGVAPEEGAPDPTNTRVVLARDGNGYPIIMMHTSFTWAWEYVGQALAQTELEIDDRDRDSGIFYVKTPKKLKVDGNEAQIKLSHTVNGIQIAVLDRKGTALLAKEPGLDIIQRLYDKL